MSLRRIVDGWSSRDAIRSAAVVSEDGLLVHDMLAGSMDAEAIAALAVTVVRHARQLAESANAGALGALVLDVAGGPLILAPLDERHTLVVFAVPAHDIGPLLFEIRCHRPALSQAV